MEYYLSIIKNKLVIKFWKYSYELEAISSKTASKDTCLIPHIDRIFKKRIIILNIVILCIFK